jgi:hypothetical protein
MERVRIEAIPAVRNYCAQLGTYAAEGRRALVETNDAIAVILDRYDRVRSLRFQRRGESEQELSDVRMRLRQCGEGQEADIAELQRRAEELLRQIQHHDDAAHQLAVGLEKFNESNGNYRSASAYAIGVMHDGEHEGARLDAALSDLASYRQR